MKLGVGIPSGREGTTYPNGSVDPDTLVPMCRDIEAWGYSSVWLDDRVLAPMSLQAVCGGAPNSYDPFVLSAFAATATKHLEFVFSTLVGPVRNPVIVAKQAATFDQMAPGRLHLGFGLGTYREEFDAVADERSRKRGRGKTLDEMLDVVKSILHGAAAGGTRQDIAELFAPAPRSSRLPILLTGDSQPGIARAAAQADGVIVASAPPDRLVQIRGDVMARARECGRDPSEISMYSQQWAVVAPTREEAVKKLLATQYARRVQGIKGLSDDAFGQAFVKGNFVGPLDDIAEGVAEYRRIGTENMGIVFLGETIEETLDDARALADRIGLAACEGRG